MSLSLGVSACALFVSAINTDFEDDQCRHYLFTFFLKVHTIVGAWTAAAPTDPSKTWIKQSRKRSVRPASSVLGPRRKLRCMYTVTQQLKNTNQLSLGRPTVDTRCRSDMRRERGHNTRVRLCSEPARAERRLATSLRSAPDNRSMHKKPEAQQNNPTTRRPNANILRIVLYK